MTILCFPKPRAIASRFLKTCAEARPSLRAVSAVTGSTLAVPRTPSVPKIFLRPLSLLIREADDSSSLFDYFNLNAIGHEAIKLAPPARRHIYMNLKQCIRAGELADFHCGPHFAGSKLPQCFFFPLQRDLHFRRRHFEFTRIRRGFCDRYRMRDHDARVLGATFGKQRRPHIARLKPEPRQHRQAQRRHLPPEIVENNVAHYLFPCASPSGAAGMPVCSFGRGANFALIHSRTRTLRLLRRTNTEVRNARNSSAVTLRTRWPL